MPFLRGRAKRFVAHPIRNVSQSQNRSDLFVNLRGAALLHWSFTMAISKDLLEILVCPLCKATVEVKPDQSGLKCVECHRVYPIRDEIPVMLVDEAQVEE